MARSEFGRRPAERELLAKVLIGCEGAKTEPTYFEEIRQHLRRSRSHFVLVDTRGSDPKTVVERVIACVQEHKSRRAWHAGDTAWAVFDGEEHWGTDGQKQNWNTAVQLAHAKGIQLAVSNPSFELWYLLHFRQQRAALHRDAVMVALKKEGHIANYHKSLEVFDLLKENLPLAVDSAKTLATKCSTTGWDRWPNPSTGVYAVVEMLLPDLTRTPK